MTDTITTPTPARTGTVPGEGSDRTVNGLLRAFIAVAVMGWAASATLTAIHLWVLPLPAGVEPQGAIQVITSDWAKIGPIPLALIGAAYYTAMIAAGATLLHTKDRRIERLLLPVTALGVLASAVFVYLQFGPIGAVCPFCMMSATATTLLLLFEVEIRRRGGTAAAPQVSAERVWPVTFVAVMVVTVVAMWSLTVLPLPGN